MLRACTRLAGYGFIVAAPEIYHRIEPPGTVIAFDDDGRTRGLNDASQTPIADFDATARATLDYLAAHPQIARGKLAAAGFCIGGHLAFRAALQRDVRATVCFTERAYITARSAEKRMPDRSNAPQKSKANC
jgi:carboxymethylenebutenolidase